MSRPIVIAAALVIAALAACTDDKVPTAPAAVAPAAVPAFNAGASAPAGASSICLINQKALSDLDGQVQDNPEDAGLAAQYAAQSEITADVCN